MRADRVKKEERACLRRDELEAGELAPGLLVDDVLHVGIGLDERGVEHLVLQENVSEGRTGTLWTHVGGGRRGGHRGQAAKDSAHRGRGEERAKHF